MQKIKVSFVNNIQKVNQVDMNRNKQHQWVTNITHNIHNE